MSSKRGARNLSDFNEARSAPIALALKRQLDLCKKRKLEFKTPNSLAAYLSDHVGVHRTTLLRKPYIGDLLDYINKQPGNAKKISDDTLDPAVLQVKVAVAKLEASTLREQLKVSLNKFDRVLQAGQIAGGCSEVDFSVLASVMASVLTRFSDFLAIDFNKRELHDLSAKSSDRILAGPDRIGKLCSWIEKNDALPHLRALKQRKLKDN